VKISSAHFGTYRGGIADNGGGSLAAPQKTLKTGKIGGSQQQRITTMVSRWVLAVILPTILSIAQAVAARADDARTALVHACER